jgi:hypothetical protein
MAAVSALLPENIMPHEENGRFDVIIVEDFS